MTEPVPPVYEWFVYVRVDGTPFAKCPVLMYAVAQEPVASPLEPEPAGACPAWYLTSEAL